MKARLRKLFFFSGFSLVFLTVSFADTVILKNGNHVRGIVTEEDEEKVILQFAEEATVQFSRNEVARIEYSSEAEQETLRVQWEKKAEELPKVLTLNPPPRERAISSLSPTQEGELLLSRGTWKVRRSEHFTVYYQDATEGKAVANRAEYHLEKIIDDLGIRRTHDRRRKYTVYVVTEASEWKSFLEELGIQPELTGGFTTGIKTREIFLHARSVSYLHVAFPHELTHIIMDEMAQGKTIPLWFDEGFANYEGLVIGYDDDVLMTALQNNDLIPLKEFVQSRVYPAEVEKKRLFYTQGEKLVEYLITQHGRRRFSQFAEFLIESGNFEQAFLSLYGGKIGNIDALEREWLKYLSE